MLRLWHWFGFGGAQSFDVVGSKLLPISDFPNNLYLLNPKNANWAKCGGMVGCASSQSGRSAYSVANCSSLCILFCWQENKNQNYWKLKGPTLLISTTCTTHFQIQNCAVGNEGKAQHSQKKASWPLSRHSNSCCMGWKLTIYNNNNNNKYLTPWTNGAPLSLSGTTPTILPAWPAYLSARLTKLATPAACLRLPDQATRLGLDPRCSAYYQNHERVCTAQCELISKCNGAACLRIICELFMTQTRPFKIQRWSPKTKQCKSILILFGGPWVLTKCWQLARGVQASWQWLGQMSPGHWHAVTTCTVMSYVPSNGRY